MHSELDALMAAEASFEKIRETLVGNLTEPERTAFWEAVHGRDSIRAYLEASTQSTGGSEAVAWQGLYADIDGVITLTNIVGPEGQSLKLQGGRIAAEAIAETIANVKAGEARRASLNDPAIGHGDEPAAGRVGPHQGNSAKQPAEGQRPPGGSEAVGVKAHLREHWLASIVCDHDAKTDTAICSCTQWRDEPHPSVGEAVDAWIEHVFATLPSPPEGIAARDAVIEDEAKK
jgi:hypothetical protein